MTRLMARMLMGSIITMTPVLTVIHQYIAHMKTLTMPITIQLTFPRTTRI